jgi:hypothetical protein
MTLKEKVKKIMDLVAADQQQLLDSLTQEEKDEIGSVEGWGFKDVIVHSTYWWNVFVERLQDSAEGKEVKKSEEDIDHVNDAVLEAHKQDTWEEVLSENESTRTKALDWLDKLSESDLSDNEKYEWMHGRALYSQFLGDCWHDEWHFARYLAEHGKLEQGTALQENFVTQLRILPEWEYIATYNLACYYSVSGMKQEAIATLKKALKMRPDMKEWSKEDPDLDNIREEPEYLKIYEE